MPSGEDSNCPILVFCSSCVVLDIFERHYPWPEKLWTSSALHCTFGRFQTVDMTFRLAIAPREIDSIANGVNVAARTRANRASEVTPGTMASSIHLSSFTEFALRNRMAKLRTWAFLQLHRNAQRCQALIKWFRNIHK